MSFDIQNVVLPLSKVRGVVSVGLGGSRSRNAASASSDYDIGVYYDKSELDLETLHEVMRGLDDTHRTDLLNVPGAWGPWINGGGWLTVENIPVDILLRDSSHVKKVLEECLKGHITIDYQCGHPFGFVNAIYAAETHFSMPLWQDSCHNLDELKTLLYSQGSYPPIMKAAIIKKFLWEARFSLDCGLKPALRGDFNYAAGSVFRTVCSWVQVLYALNETYLMNEKGALQQVERLNLKPQNLAQRISDIYGALFSVSAARAFALLDEMHQEIEGLTACLT